MINTRTVQRDKRHAFAVLDIVESDVIDLMIHIFTRSRSGEHQPSTGSAAIRTMFGQS